MSFFSMCSSPNVRPVRTAADPPLGPKEALRLLKALGCSRASFLRFVDGLPLANRTNSAIRQELVEKGQAPRAAIVVRRLSRAPGDYLRHHARRVMHHLAWNALACDVGESLRT